MYACTFHDPVHKRNLFHMLFGCHSFVAVTVRASVVIVM